MIQLSKFSYTPHENEAEKASYSYLMSVVVIIVGLPLPIINLAASFFFYIANRNATYFVRWHCTQALLSQILLFVCNSTLFWWTLSILFWNQTVTSFYLIYLCTIVLLNLVEFVTTIYSAIETRKGKHIQWFLLSDLVNHWVKP